MNVGIPIFAILVLFVIFGTALTALFLLARLARRRPAAVVMIGSLLVGLLVFWSTLRVTTVVRSPHAYRPVVSDEQLRSEMQAIARRHAAEMRTGEFARAEDVVVMDPVEVPHSPEPVAPPVPDGVATLDSAVLAEDVAAASERAVAADVAAVGEVASDEEFEPLASAADGSDPSTETLAPVEPSMTEAAAQHIAAATVSVPSTGASDASVEPAASTPAEPPEAPRWVLNPPSDLDGRVAVVLVSHPFEDRFACDDYLDQETRKVLQQAAIRRCRQRGLPADLRVAFGFEDIELVARERHYQQRETSLGEMLQGYQLTVLSDEFQTKLDRRIQDAVVDRRLVATGIASGSTLLVVSMLFGVFRFAARKDSDPLS